MVEYIKLSALTEQIQDSIQNRFEDKTFWVSACAMNVKKSELKRHCYLTLDEYENKNRTAEIKAVFWSFYYNEIEKFEKLTQKTFQDGTEIICKVKVRFHRVYGLNLDVIAIDIAHTLGLLELERQQTLEKLIKENPETIQLVDGIYTTFNKKLQLPLIINNIALITAPNSDGQRDFLHEIKNNKHEYSYKIEQFLTTIQGDNAHLGIEEQLQFIKKNEKDFDAVVIVRGGGSSDDFKPFNQYDLARSIACFPIPVFTGIGHDRNQSISDLMARELKTPTKVASFFVDHNFEFEQQLNRLKRVFFGGVKNQIQDAKSRLDHAKRIVKIASLETILTRGFAIITMNGKLITDPAVIHEKSELQILLRNETIYSIVTRKIKNEKGIDL